MEKRILAIQDFSCLGRCSLTVAIPTISALGIETVAMPTALLSNHTAFKSWTYLDLTDQMEPTVEHWKPYRHDFDAIYTGYLSNDQIPTVLKVISTLKTDKTIVFVDPAMADNGHLYPGFGESHVTAMRELIKQAQVIKPNLTEACLLAGISFPGTETGVPLDFYQTLFKALAKAGPDHIVITGQELRPGFVSDLTYHSKTGKTEIYETEMYPGHYHGTGDLFASAFIGALVNGLSYPASIKIAHDYVHQAIKNNLDSQLDGLLYGPEFETAIPALIQALQTAKKA